MSCIINKFISKKGQYKYAYVIMVIDNDIYANPGIIFSESLRKLGCLGDLVVMVDKKISLETINLLKNFYNKIITIDPIKITNKNDVQQIILTKIYAYNLIEYEKIFLIDVDTIFFINPDNLFLSKEINESIGQIECKTKNIIEDEVKDKIKNDDELYIVDKENYGFILIAPSLATYNECKKIISKYKNQLEKENKPLKFVLDKIYSKNKIKKLNYTISYDSYTNTNCIQYRNDKPFKMSGDISIEQRQRLDHFKVWFSYFTNILNKYPEIKEYKCVGETLQTSKYFLSSLSRFIIDMVKSSHNSNNKLTNIINLYGTNNYKDLDYYHLDIFKEYTNKFIKYNVNTFDIKSFLEYLNKNYKINAFKKYYKYKSFNLLIDELINTDTKLLNIFLHNYIKIFPNVFVIMEIYPINNIPAQTQTSSDIKNNLVYKKIYKMDNIVIKNILFNLFQSFTYNQRINWIQKDIIESKYIIIISVYDMYSPLIEHDKNSGFNLFVFNDQDSKIRLSSIFFNSNTIDQYNNHNDLVCVFSSCDNNNKITKVQDTYYLTRNQLITLIYLQSLKKFIYSIYSGDSINNIVLMIEKYDKIILIDNNSHSIKEMKIINSNKIFFITIIFSKSSACSNILKNKNIDPNKMYNPENYWEYEGVKVLL